jgi:iron complex transport system ATP-binding protein
MSQVLLGVYGLSHFYSSSRPVFEDLSFEVSQGDFLALLGPNGCGKSTLLKLVAGILPLNSKLIRQGSGGQIKFRGEDFLGESHAFKARTIAYVGQDFRTEFSLSAFEAVMLARTAAASGFAEHISTRDQDVVKQAMEECHCWEWRDRDLQTLSGGERQLVALARAFAQGAKILFLDESLSQMDIHHQAYAGKLLKEKTQQGYSVVLVSHDVNLAAEWADQALLLGPRGQGRVAYGPMRETLTETNLKKLYPGAELVIGSNPVSGAPKVFFSH